MRKKTKVWLWISACLILVGCIIFGGVMTVLKWDFNRLSTVKYAENHYRIHEEFHDIRIITKTANVTFAPSEDGSCSVTCYEAEKATHQVAVTDGTLTIELVDTRKWYEHLGIGFAAPKITVYLPQEQYGKLSIRASAGNIRLPEDLSFESTDIAVNTGDIALFSSVAETVKLKTTTGKITVANVHCTGDLSVQVSTGKAKISYVTCKNLTSSGNTGDITLENVMVLETLHIERSTGDIELERCDAATIYLQTDTGDIEGTLLSEKVFSVESDTGDVEVPKTTTGGKCEIRTDTGDIEIDIRR